jgi:hypothetical protein
VDIARDARDDEVTSVRRADLDDDILFSSMCLR